MFKHISALVIPIVLLLAGPNLAVNGAARPRTITLEATMLAFSPHPGYRCGVFYVHQVAKYRVEKVLAGRYSAEEMVVDQPACDGDVFMNLPVGSRVKLTVRVVRKYSVITMHPGIREGKHPKMFYVAITPSTKL